MKESNDLNLNPNNQDEENSPWLRGNLTEIPMCSPGTFSSVAISKRSYEYYQDLDLLEFLEEEKPTESIFQKQVIAILDKDFIPRSFHPNFSYINFSPDFSYIKQHGLLATYCAVKYYHFFEFLYSDDSDMSDTFIKLSPLKSFASFHAESNTAYEEEILDNPISPRLAGAKQNFKSVPKNEENAKRIVTYNITSSFHDEGLEPDHHHHSWSYRKPYVEKLLKQLKPDIICLQELTVEQAMDLNNSFLSNYHSVFLSQTPSGIQPTGSIAHDEEVVNWSAKFLGTPMVGIFVQKNLTILSKGRFWLNENPDQVPVNTDRAETDKGFGNMNTYRATLWVKLQDTNGGVFYVFNSHYPLNGNNETRLHCAETEMQQIKKIAGNNQWLSAGDRNLIPDSDKRQDSEHLDKTYAKITELGHDVRNVAQDHYGISSTFHGFSYDDYKYSPSNRPEPNKYHPILDFLVVNKTISVIRSFIHPGAFDPATQEIIELEKHDLIQKAEEERFFASDHSLLGCDFLYVFYGDVDLSGGGVVNGSS